MAPSGSLSPLGNLPHHFPGRGRDIRLGRELTSLKDLPALRLSRPRKSNRDRHLDVHGAGRLQETARDLVATGNAAEYIHYDSLDRRIHEHDLDRLANHLGARAAPDIKKVRRRATGLLDDIERHHDQSGAVTDDADVTV